MNRWIISLRNVLSRCETCTINEQAKVRVFITLLGSLRYHDGDGDGDGQENVA